MATNQNNAPTWNNVTVEDPSGMFGNLTKTGANAAASANVSGMNLEALNVLTNILGGGVGLMNPVDTAALAEYSKRFGPKSKDIVNQQKLKNDISSITKQIESGVGKNGKPLTAKQIAALGKKKTSLDGKLAQVTTKIASAKESLAEFKGTVYDGDPNATDVINKAFPEFKATADAARPWLSKMGQLGATGDSLMSALSKGYSANDITSRDNIAALSGQGMMIGGPSRYTPDQVSAINAARVADVRAQQVGSGALGDTLMGRAQTMAGSQGLLTEQAQRDAIQAARQGFAARGLATGNAALGAELLNRDRYSRQRMFEDLGFAKGIQTDDIDRQIRNAANALQGDIANQSTAAQLSIADQNAAMSAQRYNQIANQQADEFFQTEEGRRLANNQADLTARNTFDAGQVNTVNTANANRALDASIANENNRMSSANQNISQLGDAYNLDRNLTQDGLTAVKVQGALDSAANPNNMLMNIFSSGQPTGSQAVGPAAQLTGTYMTNKLGGDVANSNANLWTSSLSYGNPNAQPNYLTGSQLGDFALNTVVSGAKTATEAYLAKSDRRLKEDIKPVGKAGDILGLTAYQFQYKDDPRNRRRVGFMAQDVKRVLPEAVREITVGGRKRLAIKPQVIGEALARELMGQSR